MLGRITLSSSLSSATPEEICARIPYPEKERCLSRMRSMLKEAKSKRRSSTIETIGGIALLIGGVVVGWHVIKRSLTTKR